MAADAPKPSSSFDDDDDEVEQLQYKIILLGDGAVGTWRCGAILELKRWQCYSTLISAFHRD
jgi:hypothetical protein